MAEWMTVRMVDLLSVRWVVVEVLEVVTGYR
jgi:hypothetical protein